MNFVFFLGGAFVGIFLGNLLRKKAYTMSSDSMKQIENEIERIKNAFRVTAELRKRASCMYSTGIWYLTSGEEAHRGVDCLNEAGKLIDEADELMANKLAMKENEKG
jgi:hypothetical protein